MRVAAGWPFKAAGSIAQNCCRVGIGTKTLVSTLTVADSGKARVKRGRMQKLLADCGGDGQARC